MKSIELIDEKVVGFLIGELKKQGIDFRMMILPDHPTPLALRTHTRDAVPYLIYDSTKALGDGIASFTEETAAKAGLVVKEGYKLMERLLS